MLKIFNSIRRMDFYLSILVNFYLINFIFTSLYQLTNIKE